MNDNEFNALADALLKQVEAGLEASAADLDFAMVSSGVLEIEFADGSKIIVNRHAAAQEMWVAARSGGFHFRWDGKDWRDTRDNREFLAALSALVSAQAGEPVNLLAKPV
jgi:CyaY protein